MLTGFLRLNSIFLKDHIYVEKYYLKNYLSFILRYHFNLNIILTQNCKKTLDCEVKLHTYFIKVILKIIPDGCINRVKLLNSLGCFLKAPFEVLRKRLYISIISTLWKPFFLQSIKADVTIPSTFESERMIEEVLYQLVWFFTKHIRKQNVYSMI